jgi:hypothetical protein
MPPEEHSFNQQPEWVNSPNEIPNRNRDSFNPITVPLAYAMRILPEEIPLPVIGSVSMEFRSDSSATVGVFSSAISDSIVCEKHETTLRETVTFTIDGTSETFCLKCILEMIKEKIAPINQSPRASDSTSERSTQRFSRYDLLRGKNGPIV